MSQDNPGGQHDATNSWNGYNHQGKIALYYAVDEIIKLLEETGTPEAAEEKFQSLFLEIEWAEDFSIGKLTPDEEKEYWTVHQVKDRQDTKHFIPFQKKSRRRRCWPGSSAGSRKMLRKPACL